MYKYFFISLVFFNIGCAKKDPDHKDHAWSLKPPSLISEARSLEYSFKDLNLTRPEILYSTDYVQFNEAQYENTQLEVKTRCENRGQKAYKITRKALSPQIYFSELLPYEIQIVSGWSCRFMFKAHKEKSIHLFTVGSTPIIYPQISFTHNNLERLSYGNLSNHKSITLTSWSLINISSIPIYISIPKKTIQVPISVALSTNKPSHIGQNFIFTAQLKALNDVLFENDLMQFTILPAHSQLTLKLITKNKINCGFKDIGIYLNKLYDTSFSIGLHNSISQNSQYDTLDITNFSPRWVGRDNLHDGNMGQLPHILTDAYGALPVRIKSYKKKICRKI